MYSEHATGVRLLVLESSDALVAPGTFRLDSARNRLLLVQLFTGAANMLVLDGAYTSTPVFEGGGTPREYVGRSSDWRRTVEARRRDGGKRTPPAPKPPAGAPEASRNQNRTRSTLGWPRLPSSVGRSPPRVWTPALRRRTLPVPVARSQPAEPLHGTATGIR